mgnify:FL=1
MKKIIALFLAAIMMLTFAACGGEEPAESSQPEESAPAETSEESSEVVLSEVAQRVLDTEGEKIDTTKVKEAFDAGTLKIGVILLHDENTGYDAAHLDGIKAAIANVGITEDQVIWKYNIPEDETCYDTAVDLAEAGCQVVISDSYGHQSYMMQAAQEYPEVIFMPATGDNAAASGLANLVNFFPLTYQSRYVSGVVAGMKLAELVADGKVTDANKDGENIKIGYVGAFPYAEVVSGYTAFYLGVKSIVPNVVMDVTYTSSWYDPTAESAAANALVSRGCIIISQHADSTGAPSACQALLDAGTTVYCVGYNVDMLQVAPTSALTSAQNGWSVLYTEMFQALISGEGITRDNTAGADVDGVMISPLGPSCAAGTQEKIDEVWAAIKDGTLHVFDTSTFTVGGETLTSYTAAYHAGDFTGIEFIADGYFHESEVVSAPMFNIRIDGITELAN